MNKLTRFLLLLLVFQLLLASCTTQKKRDDQSAIGKLWHNMNAHFNGYFNAQEILEESILVLDEQHIDNYNQQLDMFPFMASDNPSVVYSELDRAIEKVAIVSRRHPYSNWTDDCYLLAGQAQFLKRDFETAEQTFRFVVSEYRPRPERGKGKSSSSDEYREPRGPRVQQSSAQERKARANAREDAKKEREKTIKQRQKERAQAAKARKKEIKARQKARKKGIKIPRTNVAVADTLQKEPDPIPEELTDEGPVGMISIFNKSRDLGLLEGEEYGSKPPPYFLKHRPAFQEARLWLAWTLVKRDAISQAQLILEDLRKDKGTYSDVRRKAMAVQAFLYVESKETALAIPYLKEAAELATDRNERARYYYIAGQLHQELNEASEAYKAFEAVVKTRPAYDLEFGARLNMAQNAFMSGSGSAEDAISQLDRMRRDKKNINYESQLYFSMANIALRSGNETLGLEYLQKALASPSAQANNRVEAYAMLGKINFDQGDYLAAKLYYDSTLTYMPKTDLRYAQLSKSRDQLVDVAQYISTITLKDSLLALGELPEDVRMAKAEAMLKAQRDAQRRAQQLALQSGTTALASNSPIAATYSEYWAYDKQAVKKGMRDFERRFGPRQLEDNWRRSSSASGLFEAEGDAISEAADAPILITKEEAAKLLKDVPADAQAQEAMRLELQEAYFNLGRLYRNVLDDNAKTVSTLEAMHSRFPRINDEAESWYYLYLAHSDLGNTAKAQYYKEQLAQKWKDTKYAKILNDPNFLNDFQSEEGQKMRDYEMAYQLFEAGDFQTAFDRAQLAQTKLLGQHPLKPKYALLAAMASGNLQGKDAYINALRQVVAKYNDTPEQTRAKEILRLLGEGGAALPSGVSAAQASNFRATPNELHYMIVVFNDQAVDLNKAKIVVSDYNNKYNKLDRLKITNVYLGKDNDVPVLVMRRFKNGEDAMNYYNATKKNEADFLSPVQASFRMFPVSQTNYREVLKQRSVDGYEAFFRENY